MSSLSWLPYSTDWFLIFGYLFYFITNIKATNMKEIQQGNLLVVHGRMGGSWVVLNGECIKMRKNQINYNLSSSANNLLSWRFWARSSPFRTGPHTCCQWIIRLPPFKENIACWVWHCHQLYINDQHLNRSTHSSPILLENWKRHFIINSGSHMCCCWILPPSQENIACCHQQSKS